MRRPIALPLYFALLWLAALPAYGETVTTTIPVGTAPDQVSVNPATNKIYIANGNSSNVTVIDGATNTTTTIAVGLNPAGVGVNPVTNKIYVANASGASFDVIDGATNTTTSVPIAGGFALAVAVNPITNKIYMANRLSDNVTVINGADNTFTMVAAGDAPESVAVNPVTNKIYVANRLSNNVTVIDGSNNSTTTVAAGAGPSTVAINPITNKIYVTNGDSNNVTVINGSNNSVITTIAVGVVPHAVTINPVTNKIYVANLIGASVTVIDGATDTANPTTISVGSFPEAVGVNPATNRIYVASFITNNVTVINGADNTTTTLTAGLGPFGMGINPVTNKIYVTNRTSNNVTVIDGATNNVARLVPPLAPASVAVNPVTNRLYVGHLDCSVTVTDGDLSQIFATTPATCLQAGALSTSIAVNSVTNKIYAGFNSAPALPMFVVDGDDNTVTALPAAGFGMVDIAVNPVTNKIYASAFGSQKLAVIDGAANTVANLAISNPGALAVNPVMNKIYLMDSSTPVLNVVDGVTHVVNTIALPSMGERIAVNPVTNRIYTTNSSSNSVIVIDGDSFAISTVAVGTNPIALDVNSVTNKIYVVNSGDMTVIDGATNVATALPVGSGFNAVRVNPVSNKVYLFQSGSVTVIDGISNSSNTIPGLTNQFIVPPPVLNPVTNKIYGAISVAAGEVFSITEQQVLPVPPSITIAPLTNNQFSNPGAASFSFTTSGLASLPVQNVFFQFDTWQGPWLRATGAAPSFTGTAPPLAAGVHTLYAYATDAQFADSTQPGHGGGTGGGRGNAIAGKIVAYVFLVVPETTTTVLFASGPNSAIFGQAIVNVTVGAAGGTPTGKVLFMDGNAPFATMTIDGSGQVTFPLPVGSHALRALYLGDGQFAASTSSLLNQIVTIAATTTTLTLTSGSNPSSLGQTLNFTATVVPQFAGIPTGTLTFTDGAISLGSFPLSGGSAMLTTSSLAVGAHTLTATYSGDGNAGGSTSPALGQVIITTGGPQVTTTTLAAPATTFFHQLGVNITVNVSSGGGTPDGTVVLLDGDLPWSSPLALDGNGVAIFPTLLSPGLRPGQHGLRAIYLGTATFDGSASPPQSVNASPRPRPR